MATIFEYNKTIDFPTDQVSLTVLVYDINNGSAGLSGKLKLVDSFGDIVTITFYTDLTVGEETELNTIISTHGGVNDETSIILGLDTTMLTILVDETGSYTYVGEAVPGTATNESKWRIFRLDETGAGSVELIKIFANNTALFDKIWDNRASYTYTL